MALQTWACVHNMVYAVMAICVKSGPWKERRWEDISRTYFGFTCLLPVLLFFKKDVFGL